MRFPGRGARASNKESAFATTSTLPDNTLTGVNTALVKDELPELQLPDFQLPEIEFEAGFDVPLKAERLLGGTNRKDSSPKAHGSSAAGSTVGDPDDWSQPNLSDRRVDERWGAQSTHEHTLEDTMPGANGGLRPWPNVQQNASMQDLRAAGMERPRMPAAPSTADSRQYIPRDFSDPTLRSHYDPARQPLNISQQTSASAVRDMALRKGSASSGPGIRNEAEVPRRPLKSAMKHGSPEDKRKGKPFGSMKKDGGRMRRLDFGHLLHRNHSSGNVSLHPQFSSSTSLSSDPYLEKTTKESRFKQDLSAQHKPASSHSDPAARTKIFEKDVYDSAKVNVRRPPKGIQNWFDGFDISSDEEEQRPTELPAADVPPPPVRKDSNKAAKTQRPQADIASLLEQPHARVERPYERHYRPQQSTQQTQQHYGRFNEQANTQQHQYNHQRRNPSDDIIEDNMQAIEQARQQMHARQQRQQAQNANRGRKASDGSVDVHSLGGSTALTGSESRLGKSKLAKESVLSLSDTSEDEKPQRIRDSVADSVGYEGSVRNASHMDFQRPSIAPRQLHGSRSFARDTCMTNQTSGSIPITLSSDPPIPLPVFAGNQDSTSEHTAAALRRLIGRSDSSAQKKNGSKHASSNPEYEGSAAGETVSSFPSEQSHMMAVTDEEMVLLEMMRIKRAAMQKNSFTEGYQQALKREQEQFTVRRQSAQKTALRILKQKKDKLADSKIDEEALDEEQRRRLSILKQEDVDNQLKIERFFASETPLENVFPEPPSRSRAGSEQHSNAPTEELLLPRTYTPQPPQSSRSGEGPPQSERQKNTASPLLPSPSTFEDMGDDDLDEAAQLEADLSRFLASGGRHESVAFPLPPKSTPKDQRRKSQGLATLLSPSLSPTEEEEEDVVIPRIPSRSPRRDVKQNRAPSPEQPRSPKSRSEAGSTGPLSLSTPGDSEFDPFHVVTPAAKRGTYSSIISSYQAHHRTDPIPDVPDVPEVPTQPTPAPKTSRSGGAGSSRAPSPSLSTSRASPMTPTFAPPALNPHNTQNHTVEIAGSDNPSPRTYASSDQSSLRAPSKNAPKADHDVLLPRHQYQPPPPQRKKKAPLPPPIETLGHDNGVYDRATGRVGSVGSFTSASEDVLAAWAELGGGSEGFASKSRGRIRAR